MTRFRNRYPDEDEGDYWDALKDWEKEGRAEDEARERQMNPNVVRTDGARCTVCRGLLKTGELTRCILCGPEPSAEE